MDFNEKMSLKDMKGIPQLAPVKDYLVYGGMQLKLIERIPMENMKNGGWPVESLFKGLQRLCSIAVSGEFYYPIYGQDELADDKKKKDVHVIHFPTMDTGETHPKDRPFFIVCAGGAYSSVCSLLEAYPVAARLNQLGFHAFTLNYRIGGKGLFPKPMDDLAAAIRFLQKNEEKLGINAANYVICGFSAGGNLTGQWGTPDHGFRWYGLPAPKALIPVYPAVNSGMYGDSKDVKKFLRTMFGNQYEKIRRNFDIDTHVDECYPPCYIVCCKDDQMVPYKNSVSLYEAVKEKGIPVELELGDTGGHGFGEGLGTSVEGWIERAVSFVESV